MFQKLVVEKNLACLRNEYVFLGSYLTSQATNMV